MLMERGLGLVGAPNARDIGGLVDAGGRRTRPGVVFRSGALGRLSEDDVAALANRSIGCVIDLRDSSEIAAAPPDRLPADRTPRACHIPVFDPAHPVFTYVSAVLMGHDVTAVPEVESSPEAMLAIYRWMVADPGARAAFATAVRTIADAAGEPVLYHCSAGKDRTGWLTAILYELLGIDRDTVVADYLATNDYSRAVHVAIVETRRAKGRPVDPDRLLPVFEARHEYLMAAYAEADRRFGGMDGYLRDGLGITCDAVDKIRETLLDIA
jgi:protein-tyrosine phosphatase